MLLAVRSSTQNHGKIPLHKVPLQNTVEFTGNKFRIRVLSARRAPGQRYGISGLKAACCNAPNRPSHHVAVSRCKSASNRPSLGSPTASVRVRPLCPSAVGIAAMLFVAPSPLHLPRGKAFLVRGEALSHVPPSLPPSIASNPATRPNPALCGPHTPARIVQKKTLLFPFLSFFFSFSGPPAGKCSRNGRGEITSVDRPGGGG